MEFGKTIGDSFEYAKEGLVGKWAKWILLIISCIIFTGCIAYCNSIFSHKILSGIITYIYTIIYSIISINSSRTI